MKDMENLKIHLFITESGLTLPNDEEIKVFQVSFDKAYMEARRATPGSIETLVRLREYGYRIAIICNGRKKDQRETVEAIGITNLVDLVITAENTIQRKPPPRAFRSVIGMLGVLGTGYTDYMVGCSPYYDIDGAIDSGLGLDTILYWPKARNIRPTGREGLVIHHMTEVLDYIGIARPQFELSFSSSTDELRVTGIGMDIVTVARDGFRLGGYTAFIFTRDVGHVLMRISRKHFGSVMRLLEEMIKSVAQAEKSIDETKIKISHPLNHGEHVWVKTLECSYEDGINSMRAEYHTLTLSTDPESEWALRAISDLLQSCCNALMEGNARAAIRYLFEVLFMVATLAGVREDTAISAEGVNW